jgi:hypothetical protein
VVAAGLAPEDAESLLQSMSDGYRIRMELTEEGTMYFEFPELIRNRHRLVEM